MITVSLPDGSERELPDGSTALDLAASIGSGLKKAAVAATVNGTDTDLTTEVSHGDVVAIITSDTDEGRHVLRHSTAHVLAQAVTLLYPGAKFSIGPAIENGFYYDFDLPNDQTFTEDDLGTIEKKMKEIVKANQPFTRSEHGMDEAKQLFADQPYKVEIIERVEAAGADDLDAGEVSGDIISAYRNTDEFVDMCVGPHVPSTGKLPWFKLQKVAGAHWRGNESGKMLQRLYGTAWESKQALAEHITQLEEAAKRDHRKLANELDLLSFPSELGGGLAVWHPKGAIVRKLTAMTPMSMEEARFLEDCQATIQKLEPDTNFVRDGDDIKRTYVIRKGWAVRYSTMADGRRQILSFALPGDIIGLHAGFRHKATYSAASLTRLEVGVVNSSQMLEIARRFPILSAGLNWCTAREFAILGDQALRLGRMTAYERVSHLILELYYRQHMIDALDGEWMDFPLTQGELADALGLSLVHVNRQLMRLRREKMVEVSRKRLRILDVEALKKATEFQVSHLEGFTV